MEGLKEQAKKAAKKGDKIMKKEDKILEKEDEILQLSIGSPKKTVVDEPLTPKKEVIDLDEP
tara:strand:+ start:97 stop:282 length:186 start_codon:yes stop_codon:yes gene_type:complete